MRYLLNQGADTDKIEWSWHSPIQIAIPSASDPPPLYSNHMVCRLQEQCEFLDPLLKFVKFDVSKYKNKGIW